MRVWITGIAGFLGSHLAEQLKKDGHEVCGNDNLVCGDEKNVAATGLVEIGMMTHRGKPVEEILINHKKIELELDCCDFDGMREALAIFKPDVLIHTACCAHEGFSPYSPHFITNSVYGGSVATFSAAIAAGVKRIVFMSTMARYGKQEPPFTEETAPKPADPYGWAKLCAEETLKNLCEVHDVKWTIAVPHNIIGVRQKYDDPYRNVVSIFMNRMLQGKPAIVYGDGEQTRCFSPIGDVLPSLIKLVHGEADGEIVNIGPDNESNTLTINQLAEKIGNLTGFNGKPEYHAERACDAKHAHCSSDKARRLLGFEATHDLDACLIDMVGDIRNKGTKPFDYFMPIEIESDKAPRTWKERLI